MKHSGQETLNPKNVGSTEVKPLMSFTSATNPLVTRSEMLTKWTPTSIHRDSQFIIAFYLT